MANIGTQIDPNLAQPILGVANPGWEKAGVWPTSTGSLELRDKEGNTPYASRRETAARVTSVATRCRRYASRQQLNAMTAAATVVTYGTVHKVPVGANEVRFLYGNSYLAGGGGADIPVGNAFTIEPSIALSFNGTPIPITFNGQTTYTFPADTVVEVLSDPVPIDFPAQDVHHRIAYTVTDTLHYIPVNGIQREYNEDGRTVGSNLSKSTTALGNPGGGANLGAPLAIVGVQVDSPSAGCAVTAYTDSIAGGSGDTAGFNMGWLQRGLQPDPSTNGTKDAGFFTMVFAGHGGASLAEYATPTTVMGRYPQGKYGEVAVIPLGTNDLGAALGQQEIRALSFWRRAQRQKLPIFACTLPPMTTSSDSWATTTNQTPASNEAKRLQYNAWLRDGAPLALDGSAPVAAGTVNALRIGQADHPVLALIDDAKPVEFTKPDGSIVWTLAYGVPTTDGTHPSTVAHIAMAASVPKTALVAAARDLG